jgi:AP-4 complex subunit epsilon-1
MISFLRVTHDPLVKEDTVSKVIELAERYAPSNVWFIKTVNEVLVLAGDLVSETVSPQDTIKVWPC